MKWLQNFNDGSSQQTCYEIAVCAGNVCPVGLSGPMSSIEILRLCPSGLSHGE